jgi:subfamily B ATP-binding cassette protein MsbA
VGLLARGVMAAGLLGIAFVVAWRFGLMALVIGFVVLTLFKGLNSFVRDLSRKVIEEEGHLAGLLIEALQAYKYLVATGHFAQLQKGADESIARLTTLQLKSSVASAFATAVREPLVVFLIVLLVLVQIGLLNQSLAPIIVSIVLFHRGLNAILNLQPYWMGLHGSIGAVEAIRDELSAQGRHREPDGIRNVGPLKQSIEFRHVSFFYEPSLGNALDDVSLIIPAFSTVAIVGASGAGKSTLIDMLSLLIKPCSGDVIIDGTRGAEIKFDTWRQQIGYVPQDPVVFDDSVANNICLWQGDPTTDAALLSRVRDAAQQSRLHDFVASLPQAYDTQLGDRGIRLSGGERQRLAIARELFRKPSLLILDEATSALDTQTELYIRESIRALRGRMTIVMVAHRLSTVRDADHVYVFENGRCIEDGSYKALQTRDGSRLREMIALQAL